MHKTAVCTKIKSCVSDVLQVAVVGRQGRVLTAHVGPGNTNALLLSQLHAQGYTSAGAVVGQCPSVGVSGEGGRPGTCFTPYGLYSHQCL